MKKFISKHITFIIASIIAIIVLVNIPFILIDTSKSGTGISTCPASNPFWKLCNLTVPVSLVSYIQDREPIISINWKIPVIWFLIIFGAIYGDSKLINYIIKYPRKKHSIVLLVLKTLAIAAVFYLTIIGINTILNFYYLSLFPLF